MDSRWQHPESPMGEEQRKRLAEGGWRVSSGAEFLEISPEVEQHL
jgi:hypothetical protein